MYVAIIFMISVFKVVRSLVGTDFSVLQPVYLVSRLNHDFNDLLLSWLKYLSINQLIMRVVNTASYGSFHHALKLLTNCLIKFRIVLMVPYIT